MRSIRRGECKDADEWTQAIAVSSFISRVAWTTDLNDDGGITWLELYIWYRMHSKVILVDPLANTKPLASDVAKFKSMTRMIATQCIDEGEEWILSTSYARANRLKEAAVSNKHAAIQGMPKVPQEEAEQIMKAILRMKGAYTKKHREAHEQERMRMHSKPLTFRGAAKVWATDMAKNEDWTNYDR
jgi:hypothetical protein